MFFEMYSDRQSRIDTFAGNGDLLKLQEELGQCPTQLELDSALINALAYSRIPVARYLLTLGANIHYGNCEGAYYAVHNNEFEGLRFAIENGIDVNIGGGWLLVMSVIAAHNEKDTSILNWLLEHGADINHISNEGRRIIRAFSTPQIVRLLEKNNNTMN